MTILATPLLPVVMIISPLFEKWRHLSVTLATCRKSKTYSLSSRAISCRLWQMSTVAARSIDKHSAKTEIINLRPSERQQSDTGGVSRWDVFPPERNREQHVPTEAKICLHAYRSDRRGSSIAVQNPSKMLQNVVVTQPDESTCGLRAVMWKQEKSERVACEKWKMLQQITLLVRVST